MPSGDTSTTYTFPDSETNGARKVFDTLGTVGDPTLVPGTSFVRGFQQGVAFFSATFGTIRNNNFGPSWPGDDTTIGGILVYPDGTFGVNVGLYTVAASYDSRLTTAEFARAANLWCVFWNNNVAHKFKFGDAAPSNLRPSYQWSQGNITYPVVGSSFQFALYTNEPFPSVVTSGSGFTLPSPRAILDISLSEQGETASNLFLPVPRAIMGLNIADPSALTFPTIEAVQSVRVANRRKTSKAVSATSQEEVYYNYGSNRYELTMTLRYRSEEEFRDFKARLDAQGPAATFSIPVGNVPGGFPNTGSNSVPVTLTEPARAGASAITVNAVMSGAEQVVRPGHVIQSEDTGKTYAVQAVDASSNVVTLAWPIVSSLGTGARFRTGNNAAMVARLAKDAQPSTRTFDNRGVVTTTLSLIEAL